MHKAGSRKRGEAGLGPGRSQAGPCTRQEAGSQGRQVQVQCKARQVHAQCRSRSRAKRRRSMREVRSRKQGEAVPGVGQSEACPRVRQEEGSKVRQVQVQGEARQEARQVLLARPVRRPVGAGRTRGSALERYLNSTGWAMGVCRVGPCSLTRQSCRKLGSWDPGSQKIPPP